MASLLRNKRRTKQPPPADSSFSNCVQGQTFTQSSHRALDRFKPVVYLDEQGRRHGRVRDHLLQRQIEIDREQLRNQPAQPVSSSSNLYGIRNPNIVALVRDVHLDEDDDDDDQIQDDTEIKSIEHKRSCIATNSTREKRSVKFDQAPGADNAAHSSTSVMPSDSPDDADNAHPMLSTLAEASDSPLDVQRRSEAMHRPPHVDDVVDDDVIRNQPRRERTKQPSPDRVGSTSPTNSFLSSRSHPLRQEDTTRNEHNDPHPVIQLKESFQPVINEAASYGHLDIVRQLIECGQSVHTTNILERTPLHEACVSGNAELVSELLRNGSLIDQRDSQGRTPLHVAASHGSLKCLRMLCDKGGDVHAQDNLGQTTAHFSAMHNHADILKYLVHEKHLDLSTANHQSKLPIHYAAKHGSARALTFLLRADANVHACDSHGNTIAHEASEYNQWTCIQLIWKAHRNLFHEKNHAGRTPIHTAALFGSTDVLHHLLELNYISIDQPDHNGYTMAHLAASRGHAECFSCLILHGAQLDVFTFNGHESVQDTAKRSGKNNRLEQARLGAIRCSKCAEKLAKEKYDRAHALNPVEQLIHAQIQHGYRLNVPVRRS